MLFVGYRNDEARSCPTSPTTSRRRDGNKRINRGGRYSAESDDLKSEEQMLRELWLGDGMRLSKSAEFSSNSAEKSGDLKQKRAAAENRNCNLDKRPRYRLIRDNTEIRIKCNLIFNIEEKMTCFLLFAKGSGLFNGADVWRHVLQSKPIDRQKFDILIDDYKNKQFCSPRSYSLVNLSKADSRAVFKDCQDQISHHELTGILAVRFEQFNLSMTTAEALLKFLQSEKVLSDKSKEKMVWEMSKLPKLTLKYLAAMIQQTLLPIK